MEIYKGYRLSPVYASKYRQGYWHAFVWQRDTFGTEGLPHRDAPIAYKKGDIFYELDWNTRLVPYQKTVYEKMHREGVKVFFHVYDILPLQLTDLNNDKARYNFENWLVEASLYDGVLCNSRAVISDYTTWRGTKGLSHPFVTDYFHLGADIPQTEQSALMPDEMALLDRLKGSPVFLMVSSLDPRKAYEQTLSSFDLLWAEGQDVILVVAGKELKHHEQAECFRAHPQRGKHFFWLGSVSDRYLDALYQAATAVLFASRGEGFGLAVWEGARYGKPLILRDLPVFRELAGDHAFYFSGTSPQELAEALRHWLDLYRAGNHPDSALIRPLCWEESIRTMLDTLIKCAE